MSFPFESRKVSLMPVPGSGRVTSPCLDTEEMWNDLLYPDGRSLFPADREGPADDQCRARGVVEDNDRREATGRMTDHARLAEPRQRTEALAAPTVAMSGALR